MNLADELGSDLAVAFLVEKKYSKKMDPGEIRNLIGRISETLRGGGAPAGETPARADETFSTDEAGARARGNLDTALNRSAPRPAGRLFL